MSSLIGTQGQVFALGKDDHTGLDRWWGDQDLWQPPIITHIDGVDDYDDVNWTTPWWPRTGNLFGGFNGGEDWLIGAGARYSETWTKSGVNGRMIFLGYTRDVYGSVLPSCLVKLFRTADNVLQDSGASDVNGLYRLTTAYYEAHYLVIHKSGSPEVAGATISTLLPA